MVFNTALPLRTVVACSSVCVCESHVDELGEEVDRYGRGGMYQYAPKTVCVGRRPPASVFSCRRVRGGDDHGEGAVVVAAAAFAVASPAHLPVWRRRKQSLVPTLLVGRASVARRRPDTPAPAIRCVPCKSSASGGAAAPAQRHSLAPLAFVPQVCSASHKRTPLLLLCRSVTLRAPLKKHTRHTQSRRGTRAKPWSDLHFCCCFILHLRASLGIPPAHDRAYNDSTRLILHDCITDTPWSVRF